MTNVRTLTFLAGLTWYIGAFVLLSKGSRLLLQAERINPDQAWPWVALSVGVLIGIVKARYLLVKSCRRNLQRIANLTDPRWWQFFRPRFFVFLAIVITLGITASRQAEGHYVGLNLVAGLDLSVGAGLLFSGVAFLKSSPMISSPIKVTAESRPESLQKRYKPVQQPRQ
jgi:hypothetical protein